MQSCGGTASLAAACVKMPGSGLRRPISWDSAITSNLSLRSKGGYGSNGVCGSGTPGVGQHSEGDACGAYAGNGIYHDGFQVEVGEDALEQPLGGHAEQRSQIGHEGPGFGAELEGVRLRGHRDSRPRWWLRLVPATRDPSPSPARPDGCAGRLTKR